MNRHILHHINLTRQLHIFVLTLFVALLLSSWSRAQNTASPRASVINPSWDFGYLPQKSEVSVDFYIYNTGSAPLDIKKIVSGCSCTTISRIDHLLLPGDSAAVTVTFKTGRYRGNVKKTTKVYTDDPNNEILNLTITAYVLKRGEEPENIVAVPPVLNWKLENDRLIFQDSVLDILNRGMNTVPVGILGWPDGIIEQIKLPSYLEPGDSLNLTLRLVSKNMPPPKNRTLSITLSFTGSDTTKITIPIKIK